MTLSLSLCIDYRGRLCLNGWGNTGSLEVCERYCRPITRVLKDPGHPDQPLYVYFDFLTYEDEWDKGKSQ